MTDNCKMDGKMERIVQLSQCNTCRSRYTAARSSTDDGCTVHAYAYVKAVQFCIHKVAFCKCQD